MSIALQVALVVLIGTIVIGIAGYLINQSAVRHERGPGRGRDL